ncbi:hypothetical protein HanXRQr2_Chr14g0658031 [Helianthus annuus]|uniref:Uncharacterized protein n=1 Tax=Helianthus annuus TaxID=4232 RepID=A0A9K3EBW0_HELAN|nr:hypothetical protein HanXRQr2_Chr14g0658031 [Helianthus annuus]
MGSSALHTFAVRVRVNSIVCLFGLRNCVKCVTKTCVSGRIKHASLFAFCWPITIVAGAGGDAGTSGTK